MLKRCSNWLVAALALVFLTFPAMAQSNIVSVANDVVSFHPTGLTSSFITIVVGAIGAVVVCLVAWKGAKLLYRVVGSFMGR